MATARGGLGAGGAGRLVFLAVLVVVAITGCGGATGRAPAVVPPGVEMVLRNLSRQTVWVYLERNEFAQLLGSVPALGRRRLEIPAELARTGARVRLSATKRAELPWPTELVTDVTLPIEEVRWMEWTLTGSTLSEGALHGVPLAGGSGRP
jgi:hypothetical protein